MELHPDHDWREEKDSMGSIRVPGDRLWGAQTQRSLEHFAISSERFPPEFIHAICRVKIAAAQANVTLAELDPRKAEAIIRAANEVLDGKHPNEFPLVVWQTGSGTQTNMNVNEVLANRASQFLGGSSGGSRLVHPNDDVNRSQSSNDVIPTAMNLSAVLALRDRVLPEVKKLRDTLFEKSQYFLDTVKIGRTHLMDATPLTLGQEFSGYVAQLDRASQSLIHSLTGLSELAIGGTAVGTGINCPRGFSEAVVESLRTQTRHPFRSAPNKFEALAAHDALLSAHAALRGLAVALFKIANDIRWLASGPRCGIGELLLPENEPGSSIMPGKVNPTQCEAMLMVCTQVMGLDAGMVIAASQGNFELNAFKPLLIYNFLFSSRLLSDACSSFRRHCAEGIQAEYSVIRKHLDQSLMLATALSPHIGYDLAAKIAQTAHHEGMTLKEAALLSGSVSESDFHTWVDPKKMLGN